MTHQIPTTRQGTVLATLDGRGSMTAGDIGVRCDVLWRMEERGWVTSSMAVRDRNTERWAITTAGRAARDRYQDALARKGGRNIPPKETPWPAS